MIHPRFKVRNYRLSWIETFAYIAKDGQFGAMMQVSLTNDVRVQS